MAQLRRGAACCCLVPGEREREKKKADKGLKDEERGPSRERTEGPWDTWRERGPLLQKKEEDKIRTCQIAGKTYDEDLHTTLALD